MAGSSGRSVWAWFFFDLVLRIGQLSEAPCLLLMDHRFLSVGYFVR